MGGHHQHHHHSGGGLLSFHLHLPHKGGGRRDTGMPPKGWMGIRVGGEGEEQQRFVVPVEYLNHPLFVGLLKEAEEEYGFEQKGAITIPCHVEYFRRVQYIIDRDSGGAAAAAAHHGHGHGHAHGGHHHHLAGCFRA